MSTNPKTAETSATSSASNGAWRWPAIVICLLAGQLVASGVTIYLATNSPTMAVEPNYYEKALKWDEYKAARLKGHELGWKASIVVAETPDEIGNRLVTCALHDRDGQPIPGATIAAAAHQLSVGGEPLELRFAPMPDGSYATAFRPQRTGHWEFALKIERGDEKFYDTLRVDIAAAPRGGAR